MTIIHILLLVGCAFAIYEASEWFVNSVEWLGVHLKMGTLAIGTILAAIGTALPESIVTLVAVTMSHGKHAKDICVGAAMAGPLALGTIAYGVTGFVLWRQKKANKVEPTVAIDLSRLPGDQKWFLGINFFKIALGLIAFAWKPALGLVFFVLYGLYFYREMSADAEIHDHADLDPLKIQPKKARPDSWAIALQTLVTLTIIFFASQLFVAQLEWAGPAIGIPATMTALLLSPIATELPEVMNAVIWVRQGKTALALANISGSMMIQTTIPTGIAILFTTWKFDSSLISASIVTSLAVVYLLWLLATKRFTSGRIAAVAGLYAVFGATLLFV